MRAHTSVMLWLVGLYCGSSGQRAIPSGGHPGCPFVSFQDETPHPLHTQDVMQYYVPHVTLVLSTAHTVTTSNIIFTQYSACAVLRPDSSVRVEVSTERWRPLVVEVGAMGSVSGISKLAASVIGPLADRGVSVFCLSTNMEDYVMVS